MTDAPKMQTLTPERQMQAQQIGAVFNSIHQFLNSLEPVGENGPRMTKELENAHTRVDEAAHWAIKSVLAYGMPTPQAPPTPAADTAANEGPAAETPQPAAEAAPTDVQPVADVNVTN